MKRKATQLKRKRRSSLPFSRLPVWRISDLSRTGVKEKDDLSYSKLVCGYSDAGKMNEIPMVIKVEKRLEPFLLEQEMRPVVLSCLDSNKLHEGFVCSQPLGNKTSLQEQLNAAVKINVQASLINPEYLPKPMESNLGKVTGMPLGTPLKSTFEDSEPSCEFWEADFKCPNSHQCVKESSERDFVDDFGVAHHWSSGKNVLSCDGYESDSDYVTQEKVIICQSFLKAMKSLDTKFHYGFNLLMNLRREISDIITESDSDEVQSVITLFHSKLTIIMEVISYFVQQQIFVFEKEELTQLWLLHDSIACCMQAYSLYSGKSTKFPRKMLLSLIMLTGKALLPHNCVATSDIILKLKKICSIKKKLTEGNPPICSCKTNFTILKQECHECHLNNLLTASEVKEDAPYSSSSFFNAEFCILGFFIPKFCLFLDKLMGLSPEDFLFKLKQHERMRFLCSPDSGLYPCMRHIRAPVCDCFKNLESCSFEQDEKSKCSPKYCVPNACPSQESTAEDDNPPSATHQTTENALQNLQQQSLDGKVETDTQDTGSNNLGSSISSDSLSDIIFSSQNTSPRCTFNGSNPSTTQFIPSLYHGETSVSQLASQVEIRNFNHFSEETLCLKSEQPILNAVNHMPASTNESNPQDVVVQSLKSIIEDTCSQNSQKFSDENSTVLGMSLTQLGNLSHLTSPSSKTTSFSQTGPAGKRGVSFSDPMVKSYHVYNYTSLKTSEIKAERESHKPTTSKNNDKGRNDHENLEPSTDVLDSLTPLSEISRGDDGASSSNSGNAKVKPSNGNQQKISEVDSTQSVSASLTENPGPTGDTNKQAGATRSKRSEFRETVGVKGKLGNMPVEKVKTSLSTGKAPSRDSKKKRLDIRGQTAAGGENSKNNQLSDEETFAHESDDSWDLHFQSKRQDIVCSEFKEDKWDHYLRSLRKRYFAKYYIDKE